ncbi:unnamed protein product, partial [Allacma fusca]
SGILDAALGKLPLGGGLGGELGGGLRAGLGGELGAGLGGLAGLAGGLVNTA